MVTNYVYYQYENESEAEIVRVSILILFVVNLCSAYTLNELIDAAFRSSGEVQNSDIQAELNKNEYKSIRSLMFPRIYLDADYTYFMKSYDRYADESDFKGYTSTYEDESITIPRYPDKQDLIITDMLDDNLYNRSFAPKKNALELGISIEQPIFKQGKVITALRQNKTAGSVLVCNWQKSHMEVKAMVSRHYFTYLLAYETEQIMNTFLHFREKKHKDALVLFESGEILSLDTIESYLGILELEEQVLASESRVAEAETVLRKTAGLDSVKDFSIQGELDLMKYSLSLDSMKSLMLTENKEFTHLQGELDLAELGIEMEKRNYLPEVFAGLDVKQMTHFNSGDYFNFEPESRFFLGVRYNLFTSGQRHFDVIEAEYKQRMVLNRMHDLERELLLELKSLWDERELVQERIDRANKTITAAEAGMESATELFSSGVITLQKLNIFEEQLLKARLNYLEAVHAYNLIVVDIRLLTADFLYD